MSVIIYQLKNHKRSAVLCRNAKKGLEAAGHHAQIRWEDEYSYPEADVAVFYGYCGNFPRIMEEYETSVYIDLGYWSRVGDARYDGYHKLSVNGRHPTQYFQKSRHDDKRLKELGINISPWAPGDHILVTGMSGKGAAAEGYKPQEWESNAVKVLREHTDRPIIYRPKPSWAMSFPIEGSVYGDKTQSMESALANCHAVVTHHSNCAVEALVSGVPVFVMAGVARPMGLTDLKKIEDPWYCDGRQQWAQDISYCQWSTEEIATREPWDHLSREGLL